MPPCIILYCFVSLVPRREESELCAFIRLEGDFEIGDEKHYCEKESATKTNTKIGFSTCIARKFGLSANKNLTSCFTSRGIG